MAYDISYRLHFLQGNPNYIFVTQNHLSINVCISGLPVTIRLLDPPLHEFLPEGHVEDIVRELCAETGAAEDDVLARMEKLSEVNPMLGFRGCRLVLFICLAMLEIEIYPFDQQNKV